jgi:hypothetical protein
MLPATTDRSVRQPRALARMRRDAAADWRRWTPAERFAARLALLLAAACLARILLAAG